MFDDVDDNSTVSGYKPLFNPVPIHNDTDEHLPPSTSPVCLEYKVASDKDMKKVADSGKAYTSSDIDYTMKVHCIWKCLNIIVYLLFYRSRRTS